MAEAEPRRDAAIATADIIHAAIEMSAAGMPACYALLLSFFFPLSFSAFTGFSFRYFLRLRRHLFFATAAATAVSSFSISHFAAKHARWPLSTPRCYAQMPPRCLSGAAKSARLFLRAARAAFASALMMLLAMLALYEFHAPLRTLA